MITNKKFALSFRIISLIVAISGVLLSAIKPDGSFNFAVFRYYTLQSNLIAVVLFAVLAFKTATNLNNSKLTAGFYPRFQMICVVDILLTFLIYWVLLAPNAFSMGESKQLFNYSNLSVHLITPLLCLIDYILFTSSDHLKYRDVYKVAIYPLFYVSLSTILGFSGHVYNIDPTDGLPVRFPYFFFDYDRVGWLALVYILIISLIFIAISHLFYLFDKKYVKKIILK